MRSSMTGRTSAVEILLRKGADVEAEDNNGDTALKYAVKFGHERVAEMLRAHGAK